MFPERQIGPHREWRNEVEYLDALFDNGAAYTVGKMNGDHWLLYMTTPPEENEETELSDAQANLTVDEATPPRLAAPHMTSSVASSATLRLPAAFVGQDYTLELLMTKLGAGGRRPFLFLEEDMAAAAPSEEASTPARNDVSADGEEIDSDAACKAKGALVSRQLGIDSIFPQSRTRLDSYGFEPCGYSANALVNTGSPSSSSAGEEGYYTIHVTPEEGWSYASFECNVLVHPSRSQQWMNPPPAVDGEKDQPEQKVDQMPDLETLIQRVVNIFQPGHVTLTLFVSNDSDSASSDGNGEAKSMVVLHDDEPTSVEIAQRAFRHALLPRGYRRTDKINYEFGDYDLAFATFSKK